ncbi:MAG: thiamine phosphate synthase [Longimicrobiales bacterium]|nr:thiamine phosphate synthase [Longimicrobiales bacterium]
MKLPESLRDSLRLIVITDGEMAKPRSVEVVVDQVLRAGVRAIQLRDKAASARALLNQALRLREQTREWGALLFVNDRFDVALAAEADGVHLGPDDLPVETVRKAAPRGFLIGASTDEPEMARRAEAAGADYIGCGAVFPTSTKTDAGEVIGVEGLARVAAAVDIPVVGIGGVTVGGARRIAEESGAAGVAVISAIMAAKNPGAEASRLMELFGGRPQE